MKNPYKRWREDHVFFLDEGFDGDDAYAALAQLGVSLQRFRTHFPDPQLDREHGVEDPRVIQRCNRDGWILLTLDANMHSLHRKEIAASKWLAILATAHNSPDDVMEWIRAFERLLPKLQQHNFKKRPRPWFACFNRQGQFTVGPHVVTWSEKSRRTQDAAA